VQAALHARKWLHLLLEPSQPLPRGAQHLINGVRNPTQWLRAGSGEYLLQMKLQEEFRQAERNYSSWNLARALQVWWRLSLGKLGACDQKEKA